MIRSRIISATTHKLEKRIAFHSFEFAAVFISFSYSFRQIIFKIVDVRHSLYSRETTTRSYYFFFIYLILGLLTASH